MILFVVSTPESAGSDSEEVATIAQEALDPPEAPTTTQLAVTTTTVDSEALAAFYEAVTLADFYEAVASATTTTTAPPPPPTTIYIPPTTSAPAPAPVPQVPDSGGYGSGANWDGLAQCESGGNWSINNGNGFYGGLQFHHQTWVGFGGQQYASYAHLASREQQIAIAEKVLAAQGRGAWPGCTAAGAW
jgi:hypothetical protein